MNIKKIEELVKLMNENDISEIEIEQEGMKVKVLKKNGGIVEHAIAVPHHQAAVLREAAPAQAQDTAATAQVAKNLKEIKAPMVGTFYRSPSPEAPPYVQVGDVIHKNDVLCIVEAMKLMNEVKSEMDGKVVNILVENAEPVEFGQVMFLVEPI